MISFLSSIEWVHGLGWILIHSIWQIALISILSFFLLKLFREQSASFRYNLMVGALFTVILFMGITAILNQQEKHEPLATPIMLDQGIEKGPTVGEMPAITYPQNIGAFLQKNMHLLVLLWLTGVFLFTLRLIGAYAFLTHLRYWGTESFAPEWDQRIEQLIRQMGLKKKVVVAGSILVKEPITFGHFKPIVLFPLALLTKLDISQVEALILHELAHIKRRDFLVNLMQSLLETLLFYHPGIWWMSKVIRELREECCDDLVLERAVDPLQYAATLLEIHKHLSIPSKMKLAMKTSVTSTHLSTRIKRLINAKEDLNYWRPRLSRVFLMLSFGLLFLVLGACTSLMVKQSGAVSVAADKMNVFYLGIENPITVAVAGVPDDKVKLTSEDVDLVALGGGKYNAKAHALGEARIRVVPEGGKTQEVVFRVKRIPDPIARVGKTTGGTYPAAQFKTANSVNIFLNNFDFDVSCSVVSYNIVRVGKQEDPIEVLNHGSEFDNRSLQLVQKAAPGDIYYFEKVIGQCPGDAIPRELNAMVFRIK